MKLKPLLLRMIPDLHMKIKAYCVMQDISMNEYIVGLIEEDIKTKEKL